MSERFRLATYIRWEEGHGPNPPFCSLKPDQPLLLSVQDASVFVSDLYSIGMGFVPPNDGALIKAKISAGEILMAKVTGRCACVMRPILVWSEGEDPKDEIKISKKKPVPEKV